MALNITTLDDINNANTKIVNAQEKYATALEKVKNLIIQSEQSWNSITAKESRERVLKAIDNEFAHRKDEMTAQSKFLQDTAEILVESQEEIQQTLA